jgi:predicted RNA-binding protein with PUA-like domain
LLKTEPEVFSFADLEKAPGKTTGWDGVRNYQARNFMRDQMQVGDGVLIYHSNADPPGIAGVAEVARTGYPDPTQFNAKHHHYDPAAKQESPTWYMVDVRAKQKLTGPLSLPELREVPGLGKMVLLQKGSRLSVQPVSPEEWNIILKLGGQ